jgi:hypothetical protein
MDGQAEAGIELLKVIREHQKMLTEAQWAVLKPLVERCRPHAKVPWSNL